MHTELIETSYFCYHKLTFPGSWYDLLFLPTPSRPTPTYVDTQSFIQQRPSFYNHHPHYKNILLDTCDTMPC